MKKTQLRFYIFIKAGENNSGKTVFPSVLQSALLFTSPHLSVFLSARSPLQVFLSAPPVGELNPHQFAAPGEDGTGRLTFSSTAGKLKVLLSGPPLYGAW